MALRNLYFSIEGMSMVSAHITERFCMTLFRDAFFWSMEIAAVFLYGDLSVIISSCGDLFNSCTHFHSKPLVPRYLALVGVIKREARE